MSLRLRFAITFLLLLLTLCCVTFVAKSTIESWQQFRQQNALAMSGDVHTIGPWMTIPYIAHTYHVPETYLCSQLQLTDSPALHHTTLHLIAMRSHRPLNVVVRQVQRVVSIYRKQHPLRPPPTPRDNKNAWSGRSKV